MEEQPKADHGKNHINVEVYNPSSSLDPEYSLLSYRMLEALRKGDEQQIKVLWNSWPKDYLVSESAIRASPSPLHLSVTCATLEVNQFVLKLDKIDINAQDANGNTPLHLAAKSGRLEIIKLLLKCPSINPTILNSKGQTAEKVSTLEGLSVFQVLKQEFIADKIIFLDHHLVQPTKGNVQALVKFFSENPRAHLLDINHRHPLSGSTCLHQAVALGDDGLVAQLLKLGANVFARDKKGHAPIDLAKTDKIKLLLKEETPSSVVAADPNQLPKLEGQLKKWTNYAGGYKLRWFVLEGGFLSYYRSQEDTINACRGSLNLANANLWIDSNDPQKFEVTGKDLTRFHLWAAMLDEAKMWIVAITQTKQYLQNRFDPPAPDLGILATSYSAPGLPHISVETLNPPAEVSQIIPEKPTRSRTNSVDSSDLELPSDENLTMTLNSSLTQFDLLERLISMLEGNIKANTQKDNLESQLSLVNTIKQCLSSARHLHLDASELQKQREEYWRFLYRREADQNKLWTESLQNLAAEHHAMGEWVQENRHPPEPSSPQQERGDELEAQFFADDDDDEFFDLEDDDSVASENLIDNTPSSEDIEVCGTKITRVPIRKSFIGYPSDGAFRESLPKFLPGTKPPAVSLWSVLKNAVGKDLTKISLPVHFNEPSSMLQRMGEDMEYSRLLDLASKQSGSGPERLLWVTAFAMSNYSSTAGRIAKPFNPLLGETFEYARPDRGYRYISEQVSHHPPISACYCDSANYIFFSEVDVKSNFWGKSYELLPQGVSHVYLFLENGKKVEHYSWKKVTTAVTNLIVGNPTIEHYGDMVVTNHSNKDVCRLTFKPNRWLSNERNALEGQVTTSNGTSVWELSGFWDQFLVAKRVSSSKLSSENESNLLESNDDSPGSTLAKFLANPSTSDVVRLWKRSPLPSEPLPFKLTPFALTLNHFPPELCPVLAPTDCRRRPDQRAMEDGLYDQASQEKIRLEEKQREARKLRELQLQEALARAPETEHSRIESEFHHKPQWFRKSLDSDTGESYWCFNHQYWRERLNASASPDLTAWNDVPKIF